MKTLSAALSLAVCITCWPHHAVRERKVSPEVEAFRADFRRTQPAIHADMRAMVEGLKQIEANADGRKIVLVSYHTSTDGGLHE